MDKVPTFCASWCSDLQKKSDRPTKRFKNFTWGQRNILFCAIPDTFITAKSCKKNVIGNPNSLIPSRHWWLLTSVHCYTRQGTTELYLSSSKIYCSICIWWFSFLPPSWHVLASIIIYAHGEFTREPDSKMHFPYFKWVFRHPNNSLCQPSKLFWELVNPICAADGRIQLRMVLVAPGRHVVCHTLTYCVLCSYQCQPLLVCWW